MKSNGGSKKRWRILGLLVCFTMLFSLALGGCDKKNPSNEGNTEDPSITQPGNSDTTGGNSGDTTGGGEQQQPTPEVFTVSYRSGYTPERFKDVTNEITELGEGVHLVKNTMTKSNDHVSVVWTIEVDLAKANVVAGTKDNVAYGFNWQKTTPYKMAQAWEAANEGEQVYASINADFFGEYCVNAFVKDGVIVKNGHNDKGIYDYKMAGGKDSAGNALPDADVPASAPMLFGVKGTTAQVAPIMTVAGDPTTVDVKKQLVQAKLAYMMTNGTKKYDVKENVALSGEFITFQTATTSVSAANGVALKVDTSKGFLNMEVLEMNASIGRNDKFAAGDGYAWLLSTGSTSDCVSYLRTFKVGDKVSLSVKSPDGAWDSYETILGCRQALVINNEIASTVKLENTNGAQSRDIPRTAVGVKNGKVVLFAVESMYYYKKDKEGDTHGMNLPELAEFAYYYGCSDAANFDGGGSTQLVTRAAGATEAKTVIRSADYGTWGLNDTRVVMNGFLITSKKA